MVSALLSYEFLLASVSLIRMLCFVLFYAPVVVLCISVTTPWEEKTSLLLSVPAANLSSN